MARLPNMLQLAFYTELERSKGIFQSSAYESIGYSFFTWHIEDGQLVGINYLISGFPKVWMFVNSIHSHLLSQ
jgi:hypothetical protein